MRFNMQQAFFGAVLGLWMTIVFRPAMVNLPYLVVFVLYASTTVFALSVGAATAESIGRRCWYHGVGLCLGAAFAPFFEVFLHPIIPVQERLGGTELWLFFVIVAASILFAECHRLIA